jgi:methionine sulfoxide reductase heme-binding subunit
VNEVFWAIARGTGITAYVALTATLVLGIVARSGRETWLGRFGLQELHRTTAYLSVGLLLTHVVTLLLDTESGIGVVQALVPFTSAYARVWVGLGVLALWVLVLGAGSGLARQRLGPRGFKRLHVVTYALWPLAAFHFIGAGSDGRAAWGLALVGVTSLAVAMAVVWRLTPTVDARHQVRVARVVVRHD